MARALRLMSLVLAPAPPPPAWLGVGEADAALALTLTLPPGVVVVVVVGMPGAVAMRLAVWLRRDEFRRKLNLDMRGDDEMVPSP